MIPTRSLDKMRPDALKTTKEIDGYFLELERILALIGDSVTGISYGRQDGDFAYLSAQLTGAVARFDTGTNLTCDCSSLTADNDYITADIA